MILKRNQSHISYETRSFSQFQRRNLADNYTPLHSRAASLHSDPQNRNQYCKGFRRKQSLRRSKRIIEDIQKGSRHKLRDQSKDSTNPLIISLLTNIQENKQNEDSSLRSQFPKRKAFLILGQEELFHSHSPSSLLSELELQHNKKEELRQMKKSISAIQKIALRTLSTIDLEKRIDPESAMIRRKCLEQFHQKKIRDYKITKKQTRISFGGISLLKKIETQSEAKPKCKFTQAGGPHAKQNQRNQECIVEQSSEDQESHDSAPKCYNQKKVLNKLRSLANECLKLEGEQKLRKTLNLFGQYSKQMGVRLQQKERRLQKICNKNRDSLD